MKTSNESTRGASRSGKAWLMGVVLAVGGSAAVSVWAHPGPSHGDFRGQGRGGPEMMLGSPEHSSRALDHMLKAVDATEAQKAQVRQIAAAAAKDLQGQRETGRKLHEQGAKLLTAPTIDAAAIEATRQQGQALRDQGSRRTTQALVDIANVLTPEQRAKLADLRAKRVAKMQERREHRPHAQPGASQPKG